MHLVEILELRPVPAAAVFLALTQRCPLTCRHCSTNSLMSSEEYGAEPFRRFVGTFTPEDHPELVLMTGGEALLRPDLVRWIAETARRAGTRSQVLSGMYFARGGTIPPRIRSAIEAVDHFAASLDIFHEEQVSRRDVLRVLRQLVDEGKDVSVQVVGVDDDDPYLSEVTTDIRTTLDDRVPIVVTTLGAVGRAAEWLPGHHVPELLAPATPAPCGMAAWPVVTYDGTVVACCNQDVVDDRGPAHLRLGHISSDAWSVIRTRCRELPLLRAIRVVGPQVLAAQSGSGHSNGYCETCRSLAGDSRVRRLAEQMTARPTFPLLEQEVVRLQLRDGVDQLAQRYGSRRYGELVRLGYREGVDACAG